MTVIATRRIIVPCDDSGAVRAAAAGSDVTKFRTTAQRMSLAFALVLLLDLGAAALLTGLTDPEMVGIVCGASPRRAGPR